MSARLKTAFLTLLVPTLLAVVPAGAKAAPTSEIKNLGETPGYMASDFRGNAWVVIGGMQKTVARVKANGNVKKYEIPELDQAGGVALGPDDHMWFTTANTGVVELDPDHPTDVNEYEIDAIGDARGITSGPNGKLYAASDDQLVSFKPSDPEDFDAEMVPNMAAREITASGGRLFVADFGGGRVIRASKNLGQIKEYDVEGGPQGICAGKGSIDAVYTNPGTDPQTVGRVLDQGQPKTSNVPMTDPFSVQLMPDGKYWFTEFNPDRMATLSSSGQVQNRNGLVPNNSGPRYSGKGKDGVLFVGLEDIDKVAIIKTG